MEILRKERSVARQLFTKAKNEVKLNLKSSSEDRLVKLQNDFKYFSEKADILFGVDERIKNQWLSSEDLNEDDFLQDCESADAYKKEWIELQSIYDKLFKQQHDRESKYDSASISSHNDRRTLRLPKLELIKFDGNAKNWLTFWSSFKKIHQDSSIDQDDKMAYLIQSMSANSPAAELVKSFPPCGENYFQAVEQLKSRYARDELLIEIYVRELLALVLQQAKSDQGTNARSLSSLYDKLKTQLRALEVLGVTSEKYAAMLYPLVESALPTEILRVWERQRVRDGSIYVLNSLLNFMKIEVESEERIQLTREGLADKVESKIPTASCLIAGNSEATPTTSYGSTMQCIWCDKTSHGSHECIKAQKMTLEERKKHANKKKACHICLKTNHSWRRCKMYPKCIGCQKRHAVLLCPEINKATGSSSDNAEQILAARSNGTTLLQTLLLKIGEETIRAFIDTGAQRSYIREDIAMKLKLQPVGEETLKHYLFGGVETKEESHKIFEFTVESMIGKTSLNMTALSKEKICGYVPRIRRDSDISKKLKINNLTLTDVGDNTPDVGLLIGADYCGRMMTGSIIHIDKDLYAIQTKLGWTLQGMVPQQSKGIIATVGLTEDISHLWNLEVLGIEEPKDKVLRNSSEKQAMEDFKENITINEKGRYEVDLPWKIDRPELLENRELAKKRLQSTTKRLECLYERQNYDNVFKEWLELGIIEVETEVDSPGHYLCHHAVIKESSLTTRVRPVFDASAKDLNGNSINSCLDKGQNFLELIPILLTKFRMHAVGVTSDIKKAFLQISLKEEDRKYLRFMWWSEDGEIIVYRHCRVVFGLTCSPFLLAATLIHHLEKYSLSAYAKSAQLLVDSFYVDNCVTSLESQQDAETFIREAKQIMNEGNFELRGWVTAPMQCEGSDQQKTISVLGMIWDTSNDELRCNVDAVKINKNKITERELLSVCNRVFDPIGFTSPTTLLPKLLLQRTWCLNISWDTQLPEELCKEFNTWIEEIHWLNECCIPRRLTSASIRSTKNSLHVFCDASKHAYATCIFLRSESETKEVTVQLVAAKSRVTPVKEITMPRLELIAALMSARLYVQLRNALQLEDCEVCFWSDSSVVLTWITTEKEWSVFVKNRVREIRDTTRKEDWKHINGTLNPADLPSRGCSTKKLFELKWWEGPSWLKEDKNRWPASLEFNIEQEEVNIELRKSKSVTNSVDLTAGKFSSRLTNLSKFSKILRTLAWIFRFSHNCRSNERKGGDVTLEEVGQAQIILFRIIQKESLSVSERLRGMKNLDIFQDEMDVTRVKTRLTLSDEEENFKLPTLLPGNHPIVRKLVEQRHLQHRHAGLNFMTSILRNDFWILGGRKLIRNVISKCIVCKRFRAESYKTASAPLPNNRIKNAAVFQVTGVDAAGPLILNTGEKCWIIIFTCAIYRAVHLELVMSMSSECFLMALRRFIARRGRVGIIYSDNGTNFVGAENLLTNINWEEINEYSTVHKIKWIFNPPAAPWWGGWWERLIQMVKQLLRRNLGRSILSFIELQTLLCDIESIINSRSLTYITEDDSLHPLTPATFLHSLENTEVADLDAVDADNLKMRQRYLHKLRADLRQRFRNEYLSSLVSRNQKSNRAIQKDDVVIVETEAKRIYWPLGLVVEVYPSKDNHIRVAKVKTAGGFRTRPVQKLYPLEMSLNDNEQGKVNQEPLRSRSGRTIRVPQRLGF